MNNKLKILLEKIKSLSKGRRIRLMEVCGTHTMSIYRNGINRLLPENIELISGPGCPVCVTPTSYLDSVIELSRRKGIIIATFGDMIKVPGSISSLAGEKAKGADIRIVYSAEDALTVALENTSKQVIFLGVGFETTAPSVALTILNARLKKLKNFSVLCGHKLIPPALEVLCSDSELKIDGFILPGHVCTIIGSSPYEFMVRDFNVACCITGFEGSDILEGIEILISQIVRKDFKVDIQYSAIVKQEGNPKALNIMYKVFEEKDSNWRGVGVIENSGLKIRKENKKFDTEVKFKIKTIKTKENKLCICGEILKGKKKPTDCKLFRTVCNPENPIGACMVSSEGTCAAYYKYHN